MSKAIMGAAMLAGAVGMGVAAFYDPALVASPIFDKIMGSLVMGGITMEAGAIAKMLTGGQGIAVTTRQVAALRQVIYGEQRVGGTIIYQSTTGSENDQYNFVIVIAGHEVDSIVNLYLDGRQVFWQGSGPGYTVRNGVGFGGVADNSNHTGPGGQQYNFGGTGHSGLYCEPRFGDQMPGDVIGGLTANDPNWAADGHGNSPFVGGCAYIYLKIEANATLFPNVPQIRVTVRGKNNIFDPRTGTKGFTTNWALIAADVLTDTQFGLGDIGSVNTDQLIAAANVCDEQIPLAITTPGTSEAQYACHMHYDCGMSPGDVLERMMPAAAGRLSRIGGEWYIWPAYWQGPSFSFDESVLTDRLAWKPYRSLRKLCNRVNGTYIAPNVPWNIAGNLYDSNGFYNGSIQNNFPFAFQPTDYPQYAQDVLHGYANDALLWEDSGVLGLWVSGTTYNLGDVVADSSLILYISLVAGNVGNTPATSPTDWQVWVGNELPMEVTQSCCISISQAQRCAKIMLLRNRQQGSGTFAMHLVAWQMQPLDVFTFEFHEMGWCGKQLEVVQTRFRAEEKDGVQVVLFDVMAQETDQTTYEWSTAEDLSPYDVPAGGLALLPTTLTPPSGLTLASSATTAVTGADGIITPRILASWTAPGDVRVTQIQVQHQLAGAGTWIDDGAVDAATVSAYISGVVSGDTYNVQIRSLGNSGATSVWVEATGVAVSAPNSLQNSYSNNPALALTQPTSTTVHMAAVAVTFGGTTVNYAARTITIPAPGSPTWLYLTIADPTQAGESGSPTLTPTLSSTTSLVGVQGNTYMGAILALPAGSAISGLAGGWPAPQSVQVVP